MDFLQKIGEIGKSMASGGGQQAQKGGGGGDKGGGGEAGEIPKINLDKNKDTVAISSEAKGKD